MIYCNFNGIILIPNKVYPKDSNLKFKLRLLSRENNNNKKKCILLGKI